MKKTHTDQGVYGILSAWFGELIFDPPIALPNDKPYVLGVDYGVDDTGGAYVVRLGRAIAASGRIAQAQAKNGR